MSREGGWGRGGRGKRGRGRGSGRGRGRSKHRANAATEGDGETEKAQNGGDVDLDAHKASVQRSVPQHREEGEEAPQAKRRKTESETGESVKGDG